MLKAQPPQRLAVCNCKPPHIRRYASVFWDLHTCPYPSEKDIDETIRNLRSVLAKEFKCHTYFTAYGDSINNNKHDISSRMTCYITTNNYPESDAGKIINGMQFWRVADHAPSYFLVISGNEHLLPHLEELRCRQNYNIILAHPNVADTTPYEWNSTSLFAGDLSRVSGLKRKAGVVIEVDGSQNCEERVREAS